MAKQDTYLYIYENDAQNSIYIGIASDMGRVWQAHNEAAETLRSDPATVILQTPVPFSSRADARKAEAVAIYAASAAGRHVIPSEDVNDGEWAVERGLGVTNISGTNSTSELGLAVARREGEVDGEQLTETAIVAIRAESMNGRPAPYGAHSGATFSERARKWWAVDRAKQPRIKRLIAILKGSNGGILGDWDLDPTAGYGADNNVFPLVDPDADDPRGVKGMRLVGIRANSGQVYSYDLRD